MSEQNNQAEDLDDRYTPSEQKWTPEDQWELLDWGHSCTLRIGEAYAGVPYEHPYGRGRCEKQMANGRRLIQCVQACKGIADPAAELARLRGIEQEVKDTEPQLLSFTGGEAKIMIAHGVMSRLVDAFEALQGDSNYTVSTFGRGENQYEVVVRRKDKPSEHELCKQAEAELAKLRTVYAAAVEEIKAWRACPPDHFSKVWSQPSMSGKHRSEFRQAIIDAMEATDRHGLTPPQPVADWRGRCVVEKCEDGDWDVVSPCGKFWLGPSGWNGYDDGLERAQIGTYGDKISACAALAACATLPPGVGK